MCSNARDKYVWRYQLNTLTSDFFSVIDCWHLGLLNFPLAPKLLQEPTEKNRSDKESSVENNR